MLTSHSTLASGESQHVKAGEVGRAGRRGSWRSHKEREDTFQTFGKEVCLTDHLAPAQMCPVYSTAHDEPVCCACQIKFGGCLPGSRAEAVLPYWVPLSLRPQKQIQKMVWSYTLQTTVACPCPCHCFGGRLPMPRNQAVMPYWVPQALRSHKKVKRQQSFKDSQEAALDARPWHRCWRVCCSSQRLLRWQRLTLQVLHQGEPPGPHLSLSFCLQTLLRTVLRALAAFW
ncbi:uncharacterized protein C16orf95 homolog isoform X1 [Manis javanica]|uniref:uncharacterized protein C16orf95 homolog isoform X1 n=1 Tax=Manis javanica TaxID=9974 RepID=UPI003C6CCF24